MFRKFQNFLFGSLPSPADPTKYYDGSGQFSTPAGGSAQVYKVGVTVDGAGAVVTTGVKGFSSVPVSGTIVAARLLADLAGDVEFDVTLDDPGVTYPPTTSIVAAAPPTLSGVDFSEDTTLTGWTTAVTAGDVMGFELTGIPATVTRVTLEIWIQP